jgi:hypothetical protein
VPAVAPVTPVVRVQGVGGVRHARVHAGVLTHNAFAQVMDAGCAQACLQPELRALEGGKQLTTHCAAYITLHYIVKSWLFGDLHPEHV